MAKQDKPTAAQWETLETIATRDAKGWYNFRDRYHHGVLDALKHRGWLLVGENMVISTPAGREALEKWRERANG